MINIKIDDWIDCGWCLDNEKKYWIIEEEICIALEIKIISIKINWTT